LAAEQEALAQQQQAEVDQEGQELFAQMLLAKEESVKREEAEVLEQAKRLAEQKRIEEEK
jgi:hypothetical protein